MPVALAVLELSAFLLAQPPERQGYRCEPPCLAGFALFKHAPKCPRDTAGLRIPNVFLPHKCKTVSGLKTEDICVFLLIKPG